MSAMDTAISSMRTEQKKVAIAAHNVANSDSENYAKIKTEQVAIMSGGTVQGAEIIAFRTDTDTFLEEQLLQEISQYSYVDTKKYYHDKIDAALGTPGALNSLDTEITEIFNQFRVLSLQPDNVAQKLIIVQQLQNVTTKISSLANQLEELRYNADHKIHHETTALNSTLSNLYALNKDMVASSTGSIEYIAAETSFKAALQQAAAYFRLKSYQNADGYINLYTTNGYSLLSESMIYQLQYQPANNLQTFIDDAHLNPLLLKGFTPNMSDSGLQLEMTNDGPSSNIHHSFVGGNIAALLDIRDKEIPRMLSQLDILAKKMKDAFNTVHNDINGFPPATELTGSYMVNRTQQLNFTGNFRLGLVDVEGLPIANLSHLDLNFNTLNSGDGPGKSNLQGVINEINYHFGAKIALDNSVKLGNLRDIKLVVNSPSIEPSGPLQLDFELENYSGSVDSFQVLGVTAVDGNNANILGAFNNSSIYPADGVTTRTSMSGPSVTLNNGASPITYPYTIDIDVMVVSDGRQHFSTLTYVIDTPPVEDPFNGLINKRFSIKSATGDGVVAPSPFNTSLLRATLVDENDNEIALNSTATGRIKLIATNNNYRIAYDAMDSRDVGNPNYNIIASNETFSKYLGFNDLFTRKDSPLNWSNVKNSAYYFDVRKDIKLDANNLSTTNYRKVMQNSIDGKPIYKYELTAGDAEAINSYLNIANSTYHFPSTGSLPATHVTFNNYAATIISFSASQSNFNRVLYDKHKLDKEALRDNLDTIRSVDFNVELMKLDTYQKIYAASAKVVQTMREFDQIMLSAFQ